MKNIFITLIIATGLVGCGTRDYSESEKEIQRKAAAKSAAEEAAKRSSQSAPSILEQAKNATAAADHYKRNYITPLKDQKPLLLIAGGAGLGLLAYKMYKARRSKNRNLAHGHDDGHGGHGGGHDDGGDTPPPSNDGGSGPTGGGVAVTAEPAVASEVGASRIEMTRRKHWSAAWYETRMSGHDLLSGMRASRSRLASACGHSLRGIIGPKK